ncbi:MAG: sulfatase-like hydrolase/transferase [Roseivirga sp.]|nr:sulfatase-like hydrolase/transferase [Roseivirga sp.]
MNRFSILLLLVSLSSFISCSSDESVELPEPTSDSPNVLLIIADDMGLDATPGFTEGSIKPNMPNLEALMASGLTFENFWSAPVCTPTRATILTGRYGIHTGILGVGDNITTSETSLQSYMDNNSSESYSQAVIGKWHLSNNSSNPNNMGINYYAGLLGGGVASYSNWTLTENGNSSQSTEYITSKFTDLAIDWVSQQNSPWFLWLAYNAPHTPFHLPPANLHSQGNLPVDAASIDANPTPYYLAAIEAMDSEIGRLLKSMSAEERANTVILFVGDNGTPNQVAQFPYSRQKAKGSLYQGGINVLLVAAGHGVSRAGSREAALINSTDLFATIADLTGSGSSDIHDSRSFKPLFTIENQKIRDFAYSEVNENNVAGYAIRNETYKLIAFENGDKELFNLINDPYENTDLLSGNLNAQENAALTALEAAAAEIRR